MRNKFGTFCMVLGVALVFAAMSLSVRNRWEAGHAERSVEEVMPRLREEMNNPLPVSPDSGTTAESGITPESGVSPEFIDPSMTEAEIDGYRYIGCLAIPSLGLELPVMAEWDYPRLKIAPCRYSGSTKTDDLVIAAHNYASHFGRLTELSAGDTVFFTDMDNVVSCYEVAEVVILEPAAVEEMTAGEYDLTLFTCTYGGRSRVTVRCERV